MAESPSASNTRYATLLPLSSGVGQRIKQRSSRNGALLPAILAQRAVAKQLLPIPGVLSIRIVVPLTTRGRRIILSDIFPRFCVVSEVASDLDFFQNGKSLFCSAFRTISACASSNLSRNSVSENSCTDSSITTGFCDRCAATRSSRSETLLYNGNTTSR